MARKTRSDARLPKLSSEQKEILLGWLDNDNVSLVEAVRLLFTEFDIKTNRDSVSKWYNNYLFTDQVRAAAALAGDLRGTLTDLPIELGDDTVSRATQAMFEQKVAEIGDIEGHVALRKLRQKEQDQKLAVRKQDAAEEGFQLKFEQKERQMAADQEKFRFRVKDETEKALAAFSDEIKGNQPALVAFEKLKQAVEAAVA